MPERVRLSAEVRTWRLALFLFMGVVGVTIATWVVRIPAIRDLIGASIAEMGLVIFGLSIGSMTGILLSARFVRARGGRFTIALGGAFVIAGLFTIALGAGAGSAIGAAVGLGLVGAGTGIAEIAINIEGAEVERIAQRAVLPALHGCFSLGTVLGAVVGIGLTAIEFPVILHLSLVAVVGFGVMLFAVLRIPAGAGRIEAMPDADGPVVKQPSAFRDRRIVLLGLIVLALALAEGSANDWLPLIMVDEYGSSQTIGSVVFTLFAVAMTIGRFSGGPLLDRFGAVHVLRVSAVISAIGIALVILSPNAILAAAAAVLWGLGAALGFPVTISAAGQSRNPAAAVSAVATAGYVAFLAGPPVLGFVGEHVGLRAALYIVLAFVVLAALIAGAAKRPRVTLDQ